MKVQDLLLELKLDSAVEFQKVNKKSFNMVQQKRMDREEQYVFSLPFVHPELGSLKITFLVAFLFEPLHIFGEKFLIKKGLKPEEIKFLVDNEYEYSSFDFLINNITPAEKRKEGEMDVESDEFKEKLEQLNKQYKNKYKATQLDRALVIPVFSTVKNIAQHFMKQHKVGVLLFTADNDEPSRVKLYNRFKSTMKVPGYKWADDAHIHSSVTAYALIKEVD